MGKLEEKRDAASAGRRLSKGDVAVDATPVKMQVVLHVYDLGTDNVGSSLLQKVNGHALVSHPPSQPLSQPLSQPASQPASRSASQPASERASHSQPASQPASQPEKGDYSE
jgi:hypothetical protein